MEHIADVLEQEVGHEPATYYFDGRVISWTPEAAGQYTVTVTAEYDGQVYTTTFKVTVNEPATDDPDDGWDIDWRYVLIAIVLIVMIVILVARFL